MKNQTDFASLFHFIKRKKLAITRQNELAECGLACLTMISNFHGHEIDLQSLRLRYPISINGMTLTEIINIADELGLSSRALRLEMDNLSELKAPCILHWDLNHFVVLAAVKGDKATIYDPARGERVLPLQEISRHFTGIALELSKNIDFEKIKEKRSVSITKALGGITGIISPLLTVLAISIFLEVLGLAMPFYMQWVIDRVIPSADYDLLTLLTLIFFAISVLNPLIAAFRSWGLARFSIIISLQWVQNVTRHLFRLPMPWYENRSVGDILSRADAVHAIQSTLTGSFFSSLLDGAIAIVVLVVMFLYSPAMAIFMLALLCLYTTVRFLYFTMLRNKNEEALINLAEQQSEILESIRGMLTIKIAGIEQLRARRYINKAVDSNQSMMDLQRIDICFNLFNQLLFGLGKVGIIWYAAKLTLEGDFTAGALVAFLTYSGMFSNRTADFINKLIEIRMLRLHAERLSEITLTAPDESDDIIGQQQPLHNDIEVKGLSFKYAGRKDNLFTHLSFTIKYGESVAIIGPSGCGKTTLIKLMLGLLNADQGEILFGGYSLDQIGNKKYRSYIGVVMQSDHLFAGSIADNICLFDPQSNIEEIEHAARSAYIHDEIMLMPMGYNSLVGDMGSALSGGQYQRILLARALYKKPRILMLDEATSHLDVNNEQLVNCALADLAITRIIVAHRPETIASADRVIDLSALPLMDG